jgi:glycosyltransferase involved in cell wall biosynthesis/CDP-glycerol glycerophosphotransferase (TagB/SpsB family)
MNNKMKRKFRKLKKNPSLFFSDMKKKKHSKIQGKFSHFSKKKQLGHNKYTVVSAVYNVGRYLDDYFKSIVNQRLDFKKNIQLIMVDDGSTDDSAVIIKRWQKKYPNNIKYIWKENGGQASARNIGLQHASNEWVTFIDPDDTIDAAYFYHADKFSFDNENCNIKLIVCNLIFHMEEQGIYKDTHPLKYRFNKGDYHCPLNDMGKNIQLSASTSIFKLSEIKEHEIRFNSKVKPNFEDAHFVAIYLSKLDSGNVAFLRSSKYFYRKRTDGTSTLDTAWSHPGLFGDVLEYGCLGAIKGYTSKGKKVPEHLQRAIVYHAIWYFKGLVNHPEKVSFLTVSQKIKFKTLLVEVFKHIEKKIIMEFELAGCWFFHKVGMLSALKGEQPDFQIVYVGSYDSSKKLLRLFYYTGDIALESFAVDGTDTIPSFTKTRKYDFLDNNFVFERTIWLPIPKTGVLSVSVNGSNARISLNKKHHTNGVNIKNTIKLCDSERPLYEIDTKYSKSWLLMDRDTQADDNAEHLYRYIQLHQPQQKIFFVLQKKSHDWKRLKDDGFNLIAFGTVAHKKALKSCSKLASSHVDRYVTNYLGPKMLAGRDYVFLQHGITKDDLSGWLNQKESIDCFITATLPEYQSICADDTRYKYSTKETVLTGFPRHDRLITSSHNTEKLILIMPTWRKDIVGTTVGDGNKKTLNPDFMDTQFALCWNEILHSEKLQELTEKFGYRVVFFTHANILPYLSQFDVPDYIQVLGHDTGSIQKLFIKSQLMITDYSSVAFEMAVQGKPVLYYQFDEDEIFSGSHLYSKGYFDYRRDGFGSVSIESNALLIELEKLLLNEGKPSTDIMARINNTFPLRDGKSCERVYQAISALDQPLAPDYLDTDILEDYANRAADNMAWPIAQKRWQQLFERGSDVQKCVAQLKLIEATREQGRLSEAEQLYMDYKEQSQLNGETIVTNRDAAYLAAARKDWAKAVYFWRTKNSESVIDSIHYIRCLAELGLQNEIKQALLQPWASLLGPFDKKIVLAWQEIANHNWRAASSIIEKIISDFKSQELRSIKPQLVLARCLREQGRFAEAHQQLVNYEKHTKNDIACGEEIARLAYARGNWAKVIAQLRSAYPVKGDLPADLALIKIASFQNKIKEIAIQKVEGNSAQSRLVKIDALLESGHRGRAQIIFDALVSNGKYRDWSREIKILAAKLAMSRHEWQAALAHLEQCAPHDYASGMSRLKCLSELGLYKAIKRTLSSGAWHIGLSDVQMKLAYSLGHIAKQNWIEATAIIYEIIEANDISLLLHDKPHLLLAKCLIEQERFADANQALMGYEKIIHNDPQCREQIAILAFALGNWQKVVSQLENAYKDIRDLPKELLIKLIIALTHLDKHQQIAIIMRALSEARETEIALGVKSNVELKSLVKKGSLVA